MGWLGSGSEPSQGRLLTWTPIEQASVPVELGGAEGSWQIQGEGVDLALTGLGASQEVGAGNDETPGLAWLARAEGQVTVGGETRPVEALGVLASFDGLMAADWRSLHHVPAWLAEDYGLVLTALYPQAARRHADAIIVAALLGSRSLTAEDPRLSTTYQPQDQPRRAGLELWLPSGEEADELYPVRASGEAIGPEMRFETDGISLRVTPFRWFGRERTGPGIYLRATR